MALAKARTDFLLDGQPEPVFGLALGRDPVAVTAISGNCTSWATGVRLFAFDQVAP